MSSNQDEVHGLLSKLQSPIENIDTLLAYLTAPLDNIGLLPPVFRKFNTQPLPPGAFKISRHLSQFQRILLQHIALTWDTHLAEKKAAVLLDQYFCPDAFSNASRAAGQVSIVAYSTLLSTSPLSSYGLRMLELLATQYPVDRLYTAVFSSTPEIDAQAREMMWGDCVSNLVKVPSKAANAAAAAMGTEGETPLPPGLENGRFFDRLSVRVESLISALALGKRSGDSFPHISYLFGRLVTQGLFPPSPPTTRTQPSFFQATLPTIQSKICAPNRQAYFAYWNELLGNLPSTLALQSILTSLFGSLRKLDNHSDDSAQQRVVVREEAILLTNLVGIAQPDNEELWETTTSLILRRPFSISHARIFVCWVSGAANGGEINVTALNAFLQSVLELWSDPEHVKHSLLSQHHYVTSLLLLTVSYFTQGSRPMEELTFNTAFIQGVSRYLSHQDPSVRLCGMLVAEEIARMGGKKLAFPGWDGEDTGRLWARNLRQLIQARDVDAASGMKT